MMNRALLQRQMFANGGKVIPDDAKGLQALAKERPDVVRKMGFQAMQEGGLAGLMSQQNMAATPMGSPPMDQPPMAAQQQLDPNIVMGALQTASETTGDLEQAPDFQSMMNQFSGEDKSEEERRDDLASIVGPEDAAQTPDSVLALVTPMVQISMMEEGIAPMAREAMDTPVEGDMAGGIMSMTGAGNEPPENFNLGGEVRRRGDEDPVLKFEDAGVVPNVGGMSTPGNFAAAQNQNMLRNLALNQLALNKRFDLLKNQPMANTTTLDDGEDLKKIFESRRDIYKDILGDTEEQKRLTQAQILFDIANTALTYSAPMPGEKKGLSPAQRLAMAATTTKLPQTIAARAAKLSQDKQKLDLAALTASESILAAKKKGDIEITKARLTKNKFREVKPANIMKDGKIVQQIDLNSPDGRNRFNNLQPGETVDKLTTKTTKKLSPKLLEVRDKTQPSVIIDFVDVNAEDFKPENYSDKILTTIGQYDIEKSGSSYKPISITFQGVTTVVDQNSSTGKTAIEKANTYNKNPENKGKPQYTINTLSSDRSAKGFYVEYEDNTSELVTSLDGGRSFYSNKFGKYLQGTSGEIKNFAPINDNETFKIIKAEKASKKARARLKEIDDSLVKDLLATKDEKKDLRSAFDLVRDATGPYAKIVAGLDALIGGFVPIDGVRKFFKDDVKARLYVKSIGILGRAALAVNPRLAVADLETTMQLFPDPDRFIANPETEVENLRKVKSIAVKQLVFLNRALAEGDVPSEEIAQVNSKILEIEKLIDILNPVSLDGRATGAGKGFTYTPKNQGGGLSFEDKFIKKKTGGN